MLAVVVSGDVINLMVNCIERNKAINIIRIQCNGNSNRSPYRIECNSSSNMFLYRISTAILRSSNMSPKGYSVMVCRSPYRIQCNSSSYRPPYRIQCNISSNWSPYRIHCNSSSNRFLYRIQCNSSSNIQLAENLAKEDASCTADTSSGVDQVFSNS